MAYAEVRKLSLRHMKEYTGALKNKIKREKETSTTGNLSGEKD